MASPTNLTDRITSLRDRPPTATPAPKAGGGERRMAVDYFMIFVIGLIAVTVAAQLALILWMEFI